MDAARGGISGLGRPFVELSALADAMDGPLKRALSIGACRRLAGSWDSRPCGSGRDSGCAYRAEPGFGWSAKGLVGTPAKARWKPVARNVGRPGRRLRGFLSDCVSFLASRTRAGSQCSWAGRPRKWYRQPFLLRVGMKVLRGMLNCSGVGLLAPQDEAAEDLVAMRRVGAAGKPAEVAAQTAKLASAGGVQRRVCRLPAAGLRWFPGRREARRLELDMRCGIRRGNSTRVTGLDQPVRARAESDRMSLLAAPHKCLSSGKTTQARKSPA
jgi:hypothetical protein